MEKWMVSSYLFVCIVSVHVRFYRFESELIISLQLVYILLINIHIYDNNICMYVCTLLLSREKSHLGRLDT